jgi:hypothetical protein
MLRPSRGRGAFHRRRPRPVLFRARVRCVRSRWPAGPVAARVHRCFSRNGPTRPLFARSSRAPSRPRALRRLLQTCAPASTALDHSDIPHPWGGKGTTARYRRLPFVTVQSPKVLGVRGRGIPNLDAPRGDCSHRRLCPSPDRFRLLSSRTTLSFPVRNDVGREPRRHHGARLHGRRCEEGRDAPTFREEGRTYADPRGLPS